MFIQGRVSAEDDKASKLILEKVRAVFRYPKGAVDSVREQGSLWKNGERAFEGAA